MIEENEEEGTAMLFSTHVAETLTWTATSVRRKFGNSPCFHDERKP